MVGGAGMTMVGGGRNDGRRGEGVAARAGHGPGRGEVFLIATYEQAVQSTAR